MANGDGGGLKRALNSPAGIAIVVGTVIGTGIFLKSALMTQLLGSAWWLLGAWIAAGVLSLAGALTYAELSAMLPQAGGPYVFLRTAYGKLPAFLFGWKEFLSTKGASNAAVSAGIAIFLTSLIPIHVVWAQKSFALFNEQIHWQFGAQQVEAIAFIFVLSAINCIGVEAGGWVQSLFTVCKLLGVAFLVVGAFFLAHQGSWSHFTSHLSTAGHTPSFSTFGAAMIAALWAYSGWGNLSMSAGEMKDPGRSIPRGLIVGILIVIIAYVITNLAYAYVLPLAEMANANSTLYPNAPAVAAKVAAAFLGVGGAAFLSVLFVVSASGTLNGTILTGSRIPFVMARDGQFPQALARVHPRARTPINSIVLLAVWSSLLTLSGTFDQLTTLVIFVDILLDLFGAGSIFVLRRSLPDAVRPYRTPLYPLVPIAYVATLAWLVINTVVTNPVETLGGLAILAIGLPVYFFYRSRSAVTAQPM